MAEPTQRVDEEFDEENEEEEDAQVQPTQMPVEEEDADENEEYDQEDEKSQPDQEEDEPEVQATQAPAEEEDAEEEREGEIEDTEPQVEEEDETKVMKDEEDEGAGHVEEDVEPVENQEDALAALDGEASEDEEDFKNRVIERIREIVYNADLDEVGTKQVRKMLKKQFGARKVKQWKKFIKIQIQAEVSNRLQQEQDQEDENDDAYEEPAYDEEVKSKKRARKQTRTRKPKKARLGPTKAKSAYLFFTTDEKVVARLKEQFPGERGPALFKRKGELWRQTSEEDKQVYKEQAAEDKERYQRELEEFRRANPELVEQAEREKRERAREKRREKSANKKSRKRREMDDNDSPRELSMDKNPVDSRPKTHVEEVVARLKSEKRRQRKKVDEGKLMEDAKEFCERMRTACDYDKALVEAGQPAVNKLMMLNEVIQQLTKCRLETERMERRRNFTSVRQLLQDAGFFSCLRDWLDILPNGALPHKRIRHELYRALDKIQITEDDLRDSAGNTRRGLGKVLMSLWRHKQETPEGRKILRTVIQRWMRAISDRSDNYRSLEEQEQKRYREIQQRRRILGSNKRERKSRSNFNKTVVPMKAVFDYARRPQSQFLPEDIDNPRRRDREGGARDQILKKIQNRGRGKGGPSTLYTVDITGKR
ncbi:hypothetical protein AAMO2058_001191700 [Amorphochlora amoebiformis]